MRPLTTEEFNELFLNIRSSAFHLELRDDYDVSYENEPFQRWLNGEPDDYAWFQPWLDKVRKLTGSGKSVSRVRVVTEPHTDYIRFEMAMTPFNEDAGEDVRWLPRHQAEGIEFPEHDFWLLDNDAVVFNTINPDGTPAGRMLATDSAAVAACRTARDKVWELAIPHREYARA